MSRSWLVIRNTKIITQYNSSKTSKFSDVNAICLSLKSMILRNKINYAFLHVDDYIVLYYLK